MSGAGLAGTFAIGGELEVARMGFGAMRLTGEGIWGPPADPANGSAVLRRCLELGVTLIDTSDAYGPHVNEEQIAEALHPYPADLVIATKGGFARPGPGRWEEDGRPEHLREACEGSLRRLRVDRIDLYQLHRIDPKVPADDQLGTLKALQDEGKIRMIGLSEVSLDQLRHARTIVEVVSVQNRYNLTDRGSEEVLDACEADGIAFLPWFPLAIGELAREGSILAGLASDLDTSPGQLALAWLLARSPVMLPIPGTSSVAHLEENVAAAGLRLSDRDVARLGGLA